MYKRQPQDFLSLIHPQQSDVTSCGPFVIENLSEIMQTWLDQDGVIPIRIKDNKDAVALRTQHLEQLGGIDAPFGQQQFWNIETVGGIEIEDIQQQEQLLKDIITAIRKMPDDLLQEAKSTHNSDMCKPYMTYRLQSAIQQKTTGLGSDAMIKKALSHINSSDQLNQALIHVKSLEDELSQPIFEAIKMLKTQGSDPSLIMTALRQALEAIKHSEQIEAPIKLEIFSGFFQNTFETLDGDLKQFSFINVETFSMK